MHNQFKFPKFNYQYNLHSIWVQNSSFFRFTIFINLIYFINQFSSLLILNWLCSSNCQKTYQFTVFSYYVLLQFLILTKPFLHSSKDILLLFQPVLVSFTYLLCYYLLALLVIILCIHLQSYFAIFSEHDQTNY
jgi:hypothetical protein